MSTQEILLQPSKNINNTSPIAKITKISFSASSYSKTIQNESYTQIQPINPTVTSSKLKLRNSPSNVTNNRYKPTKVGESKTNELIPTTYNRNTQITSSNYPSYLLKNDDISTSTSPTNLLISKPNEIFQCQNKKMHSSVVSRNRTLNHPPSKHIITQDYPATFKTSSPY